MLTNRSHPRERERKREGGKDGEEERRGNVLIRGGDIRGV